MPTIQLSVAKEWAHRLVPGVAISLVVASAATFLAEHQHAPLMLMALLLGMSLNFLSQESNCKPGIEFASRSILRLGIALLGMRITLAQMIDLGWFPILLVVMSVAITILLSMWAARALGFHVLFGLLTGGATSICGASAALALSAALPSHPAKEKATLFTVIGVSALSTLVMVVYPMLTKMLGMSDVQAGLFIGATIHDVAQVVGAGYGISQQAGDTATVVKLMRVSMLLPVIMFAVLIAQRMNAESRPIGARPPLLPSFAVAFLVLALINSTGHVPSWLQTQANDVSKWCLVVSISALGMKTHLKELTSVGLKPVLFMLAETVFLAVWVVIAMRWM